MRRDSRTVAITASANNTVSGCSGSPSSGTASSIDRNGCSSWIWLTRSMPPSCSPRYQAKKPSQTENTLTYRKPPQATARTGPVGQVASATGTVTGRHSTSSQLMTCCGAIGGLPSPCGADSRAPTT